MHKSAEGLKLNRVQLIALKACAAQFNQARLQMFEVQKEIGLDPTKNYNITDEGIVTEVKTPVVSEVEP